MRKLVLKYYQYGDWATATDKAIHVVSDLLHVELVFEDGRSFSSSQRSDISGKSVEGVRFKVIDYTKHPERWTEQVFWVTDDEYNKVLQMCECLAALGLDYDMRGAIGCLFTGRQDPEKFFCSEVVFAVLFTLWLPDVLNVKMHPSKLYKYGEVIVKILNERRKRNKI